MSKRDSFLLRVDPQILEAIRRWSDDEMRSMNAQIEYILRSKLKDAGRLPQKQAAGASDTAAQSTTGEPRPPTATHE